MQIKYCLSYSTVVLYVHRDQRLGISCPKISPQSQLNNNYFVTSRQYRLGITKLKNVFTSLLTHSKKLLQNFKILYLIEFSTE